jgi:hypothetical protein
MRFHSSSRTLAHAVAAIVLLTSACSSSSQTAEPSLIGNWIMADAGSGRGIALTIRADGTYTLSVIALVTQATADVQAENGTWVSDGASTLTATPTQSSCPGPDPVSVYKYSFQGGILVLADASGILSLEPNTAPAGSVSLVLGCFQRGGGFVQHPIANVTP